ncbi:hypothetical protein Tco_1496587, partial [Tanacetum coccineum]
EPEDDDKDPKEDDDEDPEEDPSKEHKPEDDDPEPQSPMAASTQALIDAFVVGSPPFPLPPTSLAYYQAPLGHIASMISESSAAAVARPPRGQYDFVDTVEAGQSLIHSPGHDAQTIARATDRAENVGYESEDFYTQLHDAQTDRRDIRLEIDIVKGQRTAYETKLHECQSAEDLAVRQMMRTQVLEARARIDTVEDTDSSFIIIISICINIVIISHVHCIFVISRIMPVTRQGANDAMTPKSIQAMIDQAIQRNSTHTQDDTRQSLGGGLRRPVQPAHVCSYTNFMKCQPLNFKGTEGVVSLSQWLKKMESVFHISGCTIDN